MSKSIQVEGLPVTATVEDAGRNGPRPNVLLICTDHLRADLLGLNAHPHTQTPQIDKIGLSGINFRRAFSECPVCCPARRILMTGMDSHGVHMSYNRDTQPFPEGPKLAELLTAGGYQTFAAGKLHTWPPRNRIGFEDVQLNEEGRTAGLEGNDDYLQFLADENLLHQAHSHGLGNNQYGYRPSPVPEYATSTGWTADQAMRFLKRRDPTRPFFLYVSFDKPHPPITPPAENYELYRDVRFPEPVVGDWVTRKPMARRRSQHEAHDWHLWRHHGNVVQESLRGMAAMTTHIDSRIGMIVGTLREQRLLANTWIIFIADHGDAMFDHDLLAKGDFFAGSCNIPLLVMPAQTFMQRVRPDRISHTDTTTPAALQDIAPTILEVCGLQRPANMTGQSLVGHFTEEHPSFRPITCGNVGAIYAATDGRHKYCWHGEEGHELLFDQEADPKDCHDLAESPKHKMILERLRHALVEWMTQGGDSHIQDGRLQPAEMDHQFAQRFRRSIWNNRGWR